MSEQPAAVAVQDLTTAATQPADNVSAPAADPAAQSTAPQSDAATAQPDGEGKEKGGLEKRFNELTTKIHALETEKAAEAARAKVYQDLLAQRGTAPGTQPATAPSAPVAAVPEAPQRDKFADDASYNQAVFQYNVDVATARNTANIEQRMQTQRTVDTFRESQNRAMAKYQDYGTVAAPIANAIHPASSIGQAILSTPDPADTLYQLCKSPTEFQRIQNLSPAQALYEIGRFTAKSSAPAAASVAAQPSSGAAPIRSPGLGTAAGDDTGLKRYEDMSMEDYVKTRRSETKKR